MITLPADDADEGEDAAEDVAEENAEEDAEAADDEEAEADEVPTIDLSVYRYR
jgi:hypothetical protein